MNKTALTIIRKVLPLFILLLVSFMSFSQEICNNGIDDDGDGLIDLNDTTDCVCGSIFNTSLIPNPSFEQKLGCPTSYSQISYATNWHQATSATSDYFNCGFNYNAATSMGINPPPDGTGYAGTIFSLGWQEYLGIYLNAPLLAGQTYTFNFQIASTPINGDGTLANGGIINYGDVDITIFGYSGFPTFPIGTTDCPSSVDSNWIVIGAATYTPISSWGAMSITFTPVININTLIVGSPCTLPADYDTIAGYYPYFYFDKFILNKAGVTTNITQIGSWCHNNIQLQSDSSNNAIYQWYLDGVALPGDTNLLLNVSANAYGTGTYNVVTTIDSTCSSDTASVYMTGADTSVTQNGSTLTANDSGATYQWLDCNNAYAIINNEINQSFTATTNGSYAVEITTNNCVDTSACRTININGISTNSLGKFFVYPNPNTGSFTLQFGKMKSNINIQITNVLGKIILQKKLMPAISYNINLTAPAGVYFLKIYTKNKEETIIKLLKE